MTYRRIVFKFTLIPLHIMNLKEYRKVYPFLCSSCGSFSHTFREYCESCGAQNTVSEAKKEDYKNLKVA